MFSKRIFISVAFLLLIGGLAAFIYSKNKTSSKKIAEVPSISPTPSPVTLLTWTDEAGFSFQYPEGTTIDKHPEDTKNYANLTLTLPSKDTVTIIMSDNTYKNLDAWVGQNSAFDTILDGRPAKKILENDLETIACIDNEVIVKITGKDISEIVKSWTFIYPTPTAPKNSTKTAAPTSPSSDEDVLIEE